MREIHWLLSRLCLCFLVWPLLLGCVAEKQQAGQTQAAPRQHQPQRQFALEEAPSTLAILPFENNSVTDPQLYAPLSKGLSAMLISDLGRSGSTLKLIERSKIDALLKEISLGQTGVIDESTAVKVGKLLGAESIAFGSYMVLGSAVRIDVRIVKVETGELIIAESITGNSDQFMGLEVELAQKIADTLRIVFIPAAAMRKSNFEAALVFSQGIAALDSGDTDGARILLEKSVSIDPQLKSQVEALGLGAQP